MQKFFLCIVAITFATNALSQLLTLRGKITDASTGIAIAGVSVFLSNTSYGSITNSTGIFEITGIKQGKYDLIVSLIGYETYSEPINLNAAREGLTITLKQKVADLGEVIIRNYIQDGWEKWGSFFLESFIGTSILTKDCFLRNKEVLKFSYSKKDSILYVDATDKLIIENNALGYTIQYQLESFIFNFKTKLLYYSGYPFFSEMNGGPRRQKRWAAAREEVYEISLMRFMRSLYRNHLEQDGYELLLLERIPNFEKQRLQTQQQLYYDTVSKKRAVRNYENTLTPDSLQYFKKVIRQKDIIEIIHPDLLKGEDIAYGADSVTAALDFRQYIIIRYPKKNLPPEYVSKTKQGSVKQPISSILYLPNNTPLYVTSSGFYYDYQNMILEDFWSWWEKLSSMLPYDYTPEAK